jgi:hypothetical protein
VIVIVPRRIWFTAAPGVVEKLDPGVMLEVLVTDSTIPAWVAVNAVLLLVSKLVPLVVPVTLFARAVMLAELPLIVLMNAPAPDKPPSRPIIDAFWSLLVVTLFVTVSVRKI